MLKKLFQSKRFSKFLDVFGIFSLSSIIVTTIFGRFLVDVLPICSFGQDFIVSVQCQKGFIGNFLEIYFLYFSLMIIIGLGFGVVGLGISLANGHILIFLKTLSILLGIIFILFSTLRIIGRIFKGLFKGKNPDFIESKKRSEVFFLLVMLPVLFIWAVKYFVEPPKSSNRIVSVDLWHSTASFQRSDVEDWSLINIKKPGKESNVTFIIPESSQKRNPFVYLDISNKKIFDLDDGRKSKIGIVPYYDLIEDSELLLKKESYLREKLEKTYTQAPDYKTKHKIYDDPEQIDGWQVYKSSADSSHREPDIYIYKTKEDQVQNILACTPEGYCAEKRKRRIDLISKCKSEEECLSCLKTCSEPLLGTAAYQVIYSFDKSNLASYFDRRQKILDFLESHIVLKPVVK